MPPMKYPPNGKGIMPLIEFMIYEISFFEVAIVMVKDKKNTA